MLEECHDMNVGQEKDAVRRRWLKRQNHSGEMRSDTIKSLSIEDRTEDRAGDRRQQPTKLPDNPGTEVAA